MPKKPKITKDPLLQQLENEMKQMKRNVSKPVKTERGIQKRAEQLGVKLPKYNNLTKSEKITKQNEYLARRSQQQLKKHQKAVDQLKRGGSSVYQLGSYRLPKSMVDKETSKKIKDLKEIDLKKKAYILSNGNISNKDLESVKTKKDLVKIGLENGYTKDEVNKILDGKGEMLYQLPRKGNQSFNLSSYAVDSFDVLDNSMNVERINELINARSESQSFDNFKDSFDVLGYTLDIFNSQADSSGLTFNTLDELTEIKNLKSLYNQYEINKIADISDTFKELQSHLNEMTPLQKMALLNDEHFMDYVEKSDFYFSRGNFDDGVSYLKSAINRASVYKRLKIEVN